MNKRAVQFMPFSALKGFYELIGEQNRITEPKRQLSEDREAYLSEKTMLIKKGTMVRVTFYNKDHYEICEGMTAQCDTVFRRLVIVKRVIPFDDIWDIEIC
ncbi:MAG: YolD-like family protein [Oscillospiraceae bacterium]|nr:YolD-like family protein [Oscillospiraceae bacterium]